MDDNTVQRVAVGLTLLGAAAGNGDQGVYIRASGTTVRNSLVSDNAQNGIQLDSSLAVLDDTTIAGNVIGSDEPGTAAFGNGADGIRVGGGFVPTDLTIGGTTGLTPGGACTGDCNQISDNASDGIEIAMPTAATPLTNPVIRGNFIGTDGAGIVDLGNTAAGIRLNGNIDGAVVRDNVIAGNSSDGIGLFPGTIGGPSHSTIAANRIGVDTTADDSLPNTGEGINIASTVSANDGPMTGNVVGGTAGLTPGGACTGDCNVISGNDDGVVIIRGSFVDPPAPVTGTQVIGNHVGLDGLGTSDLGNVDSGVVVSGPAEGTVVGSAAASNVISGNGSHGVQVLGDGTGNLIQANRIGTTTNGAGPALGNTQNGVEIFSSASGATIGGTAAGTGNTIANNGLDGVRVRGGGPPFAAAPILGNSIRDNGGLGIDLMPDGLVTGVTANDGLGDPDTGGNGLQNFPVLDAVAAVSGSTWSSGASTPLRRRRTGSRSIRTARPIRPATARAPSSTGASR